MTTYEIIELLKIEANWYSNNGDNRTADAIFNIALTISEKEKEFLRNNKICRFGICTCKYRYDVVPALKITN